MNSAKGPVSRILSCAVIPLGAALPQTLISDLPGGFGVLRTAAPCRAGVSADRSEPPGRVGPMRSGSLALDSRFPPYLVLLRVGFTLPPTLPAERCALTAPFHPYRSGRKGNRPWGQLRVPKHEHPAVCFLWHLPSTGLEARVPDVIRHTALRSSDFPPPAARLREPPAATARSSCQH